MISKTLCRVCGSSYSRRFRCTSGEYGCRKNCGSTSRILTREEYDSLEVTYDPGDAVDTATVDYWEILAVNEKKKVLSPIVSELRNKFGDDVKLNFLDIGCGMGGYLLAARDLGMNVYGIEPSATHSKIAREGLGLQISTQYFSKDALGSKRFHLIVLTHVIEHIFDQRTFLRDVYSVLSPGGVIWIATPNVRATTAILTGKNWSMFKPIDHVGMLSPRAMALLAPDGAQITIRTTEYSWEPFISLLVGLRNALARSRGGIASVTTHHLQNFGTRIGSRPLVWWVATVLSWPVYQFNNRFNMGACIVCEIRHGIK
jgi:2-polyprenyl-3-methyl-5-hydroxy-6-metoxy-1,4-benzoquinol methylase